MSMRNILLTGAAIGALSLVTVPAHATPGPPPDNIVTNQWYTGAFGSTIGSDLLGPGLTSGLGVNGPVLPSGTANAIFAPAGYSWTITLTNGGYLTFVDVEASGDRFEIFDNNVSLGLTSAPNEGSSCAEDISCALGNPDFSRATFALGAGTHTISGLLNTFVSAGDFNFIVQETSVPEPATFALLGAGLAGIGFARRRRR